MNKRTLRPVGDYVQLLQREGLLQNGAAPLPAALLSKPVALVSCDSQEVVEDTLFLCKGAHFKGAYLAQAVEKGAILYVAEQPFPEGAAIPALLVNDVRRAMALLADAFYGHPSGTLDVVGITGTKGKSSTAYYLKYIFDEVLAQSGKESAVISSIDTYDGVERFESHLTTPEPLELERHFAHALESGIPLLTMEVSSQALKYDRVLGVEFAVACFLNIGYDHISPIEHPDFEDYFSSKLRIFEQCKVACVNLDSDESKRVLSAAEHAGRVITFSQHDSGATVYASGVRKEGGDILFKVKTPRFSRTFRLTMPGLFNVQNALAAIAVCEALGIPEHAVYLGLQKARVPGRMEVYANANDHVVAIVDYAHNRLSFQKLYASVEEEYPGRRIVTVFGCPGKKALDRRKDLGEISGAHSDLVIVTEEDPGEEDVLDICKEVASHVERAGCEYSIQPDRGEAIRSAVLSSEQPTILLITGKGAETRQKRGTAYIDCPSDVEYTKAALLEYDKLHGLDGMDKVRGLLDTLPRLNALSGKTVVVKYGGSALTPGAAEESILQDIAALHMAGVRVVVVHGGGKAITALLDRLGRKSVFQNGYRVTNAGDMKAVEYALSGGVNQALTGALRALGAPAVGVSGRSGGLFTAAAKDPALGQVGELKRTDPALLQCLLSGGFVPVVSPVAQGEDGMAYNVNADDAALAVACALKAEKLLYLTDVDGILVDSHNRSTLIHEMDAKRAAELLQSGLIAGGMAPKVTSALSAVEAGVHRVVVLDGRVEHALLLEAVSPKSIGTAIVGGKTEGTENAWK
ncbi:MAG: acetylglutamate kinase [Oscillospiraceae bacterium]|nr:acetylglutamate kinase [Oscillospiraceae bacterium]